MVDMKSLVIGGILLGLFAFASLSVMYISLTDNNPNSTLLTESALNKTFYSLNSTLMSQRNQSANQYQNGTLMDNPETSFGGLVMKSVVGATNLFTGFFSSIFILITDLAEKEIGIPPLITTVFFTILTVLIIFLGWRLYRSGQ